MVSNNRAQEEIGREYSKKRRAHSNEQPFRPNRYIFTISLTEHVSCDPSRITPLHSSRRDLGNWVKGSSHENISMPHQHASGQDVGCRRYLPQFSLALIS